MTPIRSLTSVSQALITVLALAAQTSAELVQRSSCNNNVSVAEAYAPKVALCPSGFQLLRNATSVDGSSTQLLNSAEQDYISGRDSEILPYAWATYLGNVLAATERANLSAPLPDYVSKILAGGGCDDDGKGDDGSESKNSIFPRLGLAVSGGGYRASTFGAGVLNALDGRNDSAVAVGTGGLLQVASYLTGLSGGSWLVTSAVQAGFPSIQEVVFGPPGSATNASVEPGTNGGYGGWNADYDLTTPSNVTATLDAFYETILVEMAGKYETGYPVTFDDFWARLLSRHFANGTHEEEFFDECETLHGAGITWSQMANSSSIQNYQIPFPIVVANAKSLNGNYSQLETNDSIPLTNTIYEFSPYEMGSFDPMLASFIPTEYLGSINSSVCVTNYDQIAYVSGTSSALFNEYNSSAGELAASGFEPVFSLINATFPPATGIELDTTYYPNPFKGISSSYLDTDQMYLRLVDGGEDGEVIPIQPLLVHARGVDTIIAIDASADLNDDFTAGASLIATKNRTTLFPDVYAFPRIPSTVEDFVAEGLATHPTFFGCNDSAPVPLVVYIANGAPARGEEPITNTSTSQTTYTDAELQAFLDQTFDIATQGIAPENGTDAKDPEFAACLACAVVERSRVAMAVERSGICTTCFERYCWYPSN